MKIFSIKRLFSALIDMVRLPWNHTWEKVVLEPWQQKTYDVNDTVTFDPKTDPDVSGFITKLPDANSLPTWYQQRIGGALGADEKGATEKAAKPSTRWGVPS
jgi:hypothetical protein